MSLKSSEAPISEVLLISTYEVAFQKSTLFMASSFQTTWGLFLSSFLSLNVKTFTNVYKGLNLTAMQDLNNSEYFQFSQNNLRKLLNVYELNTYAKVHVSA